MGDNRDAMMVVRSELFDRLDRLKQLSGRASSADFERRLEGIISLAGAYGLRPVARLGEALRQGEGPAPLYLERMRDAIRCERADEATAQAMLASVSVRLGS
ncbi:MAG TPA: hypothetical protein VF603_02445 [Allosphingosinicella sp.]|jgi:hypothetical protein